MVFPSSTVVNNHYESHLSYIYRPGTRVLGKDGRIQSRSVRCSLLIFRATSVKRYDFQALVCGIPLVQRLKLMNAARKEPIEYSPESLRTQLRHGFVDLDLFPT